MTRDVILWALDANVSPRAKLLLLRITLLCNEERVCVMERMDLFGLSGLSRQCFIAKLAELVRAGYLLRTQVKSRSAGRGHRRAFRFQLTYVPPLRSARMADHAQRVTEFVRRIRHAA